MMPMAMLFSLCVVLPCLECRAEQNVQAETMIVTCKQGVDLDRRLFLSQKPPQRPKPRNVDLRHPTDVFLFLEGPLSQATPTKQSFNFLKKLKSCMPEKQFRVTGLGLGLRAAGCCSCFGSVLHHAGMPTLKNDSHFSDCLALLGSSSIPSSLRASVQPP